MSKPCVSPAAIKSALERSWGTLSDFRRIAAGLESQAFRFRSGGHSYVVRANNSAEGFEKDAFAYRHFARAELPILKVLQLRQLESGPFVCVSEYVPGRMLEDLDREELQPLVAPTARTLDAVANSSLEGLTGFGPFDPSGTARHASWRGFLLSIAGPAHDWSAAEPFLNEETRKRFFEKLKRLAQACPETRRIFHGDFGSNNVLADGHRISSVLDWSEAGVGDPLYDIANVFFWRTSLVCMEAQAGYFERCLPDTGKLHDRLRCYELRIGLAEIYSSAIEAHRPRATAPFSKGTPGFGCRGRGPLCASSSKDKTEAAAWAAARCRELL